MTTGVIKRIKPFIEVDGKASGGYGFISVEDGSRGDLFFHASGVMNRGFDSLQEGDKVEFEIVEGKKGQQAQDVLRIS